MVYNLLHFITTHSSSASISLPGTSEPELKIQPLRQLHGLAAAAADSNPQLQAHLKGRRRDRRRRRRKEAVDHRLGRGRGGGAVWRRVVEVGQRSPVLVGSSKAWAWKGRRVRRRRAALPEPGPVPPVDVHVAAQRLRRPELPPAVAAGVGRRRQRPLRRRPREAAGQAQVMARRRRP